MRRPESPYEIARLITLFEREDAAAIALRAGLESSFGGEPLAPVVGITGAPGVGKSTLIGALAPSLARDRRVAVLAVDPSSAASGGALLGDRTRIRAPAGGVFVRSQAAATRTGGLGPRTYPVLRLLRRLFDLVLVETVGVGQSEDDVRHVADEVLLLLQPLAGDGLQHLKAGIMEVPTAIVLTKCDAGELATRAIAELTAVIGLARPGEAVAIHAVSARTGAGLEPLAAAILAARAGGEQAGDEWYLRGVVREALGRVGEERLVAVGVPVAGSIDERVAVALARDEG
jgi:LAO/AO transport system kinase